VFGIHGLVWNEWCIQVLNNRSLFSAFESAFSSAIGSAFGLAFGSEHNWLKFGAQRLGCDYESLAGHLICSCIIWDTLSVPIAVPTGTGTLEVSMDAKFFK